MADIAEIDHPLATVGAPAEGGCCYTCLDDTPAYPSDAVAKIASLANWESLGELTNNGYTETKSISSTDQTGWHGSVILTTVESETNTYKAEFTEVMRPTVAKLRYGKNNVEVNDDGTIKHVVGKPVGLQTVPLVFDELLSNGTLCRTLVKKATITDFDDVPHKKGDLMVYGMTFTAAEVDGAAFEKWYAKPAATTTEAGA